VKFKVILNNKKNKNVIFNFIMNKKGKVIIISEVSSKGSFIQDVLKENDYNIVTEKDIFSAFKIMEGNGVDLIIYDITKDSERCLKLLKVLKERCSKIPVITVVPYPDRNDYILKSFEFGAKDSIYQECNTSELLLRVGRAIMDLEIKNNLEKVQCELEKYSKSLLNIVKHRSEELYKAEKKYECLVQFAPNIIFLLDKDDKIIFINDTVKTILGYEPKEMLGESFYLMVHKEDIEITRKVFKEFHTDRHFSKNFQIRMIKNSEGIEIGEDSRIYARINAVNMYQVKLDDYVCPDFCIQGVISDITLEKKYESENIILSNALRNSLAGIAIADLNFNIVFVNRALEEIFGYESEEILGKNIYSLFIPQEFTDIYSDKIKQFLFLNGKWEDEIYGRKKGKEIFPMFLSLSIIKDDNNVPMAVLGVARDITEFKKAEERIKYVARFVNQSNICIIYIKLDGTVTVWNKGAEHLFGIKKENAIGKQIKELPIFPDNRKNEIDLFLKSAQKGEFLERYETVRYKFVKENKIPIDVSISVIPVRDEWENIKELVFLSWDITESKKLLRQKEVINNINNILLSSIGFKDVYQDIEEELRKLIPFKSFRIGTFSQDGEFMEIHKKKPIKVKNIPNLNYKILDKDVFRVETKNNVFKIINKKKSPILENDLRKSKLITNKIAFKLGISSFIIYPLIYKDKNVGVMIMVSDKVNNFNDEHIEVLSQIAPNIAIFVENHRLGNKQKEYENNLKYLSGRLIETLEDERKRISRELHDEVGQCLSAINLYLNMIKNKINRNDLNGYFDKIINIVDETLEISRKISSDLRPNLLDKLGLVPTIKWYIEEFVKRYGLNVKMNVEDIDEKIDKKIEINIYRIVQEAINNIIKHSKASKVYIKLSKKNGQIFLKVKDNGKGFIMNSKYNRNGLGLIGMTERVDLLGGEILIDSAPKKGTKIEVKIPLKKEINSGGYKRFIS
jgi:PAS domain S-box-containing protein